MSSMRHNWRTCQHPTCVGVRRSRRAAALQPLLWVLFLVAFLFGLLVPPLGG